MIDPFEIKKYPKWHPIRLGFTAYARFIEKEARLNFNKYALAIKKNELKSLSAVPSFDTASTAVTTEQMQQLVFALKSTEHLRSSTVVEIGSFRGITTRCLASITDRQVVAVDPFIGYGGAEEDYEIFKKNTGGLKNIIHLRQTSGEAARRWKYGKIGLIFIDALHDYVNTLYDFSVWYPLIEQKGLMAFHDTDTMQFAGTHKAVFESSRKMQLFAHVDGLTILQKV